LDGSKTTKQPLGSEPVDSTTEAPKLFNCLTSAYFFAGSIVLCK
jgi:hypothetical protein